MRFLTRTLPTVLTFSTICISLLHAEETKEVPGVFWFDSVALGDSERFPTFSNDAKVYQAIESTCNEKEENSDKSIGGLIETIIWAEIAKEFKKAILKANGQNSRIYSANQNYPKFNISENGSICLLLVHVPDDTKNNEYNSMTILQIFREGGSNHSMLVRPLLLHTPINPNPNAGSGIASAMIRVEFTFANETGEHVSTREIVVPEYSAGPGSEVFKFTFDDDSETFSNQDDSAYFPYFEDSSTSLKVTITETVGKDQGDRLREIYAENLGSVFDLLRQAAGRN